MADVKLTKAQVKTPDKFQQNLAQGFQWTTKHSKAVLIGLAAFVVIGAGVSAKSYLDLQKETEIQSQYFLVEKAFMEKKSEFEAASRPQPPLAKGQTPPPALPKASGDLAKDYGTVPQDFLSVIEKAPKSKAAQMAALNLSDLQLEYKQMDDAKTTLSKVHADGKDLLSAMVLIQLGTLQANQNDCQSAVSTWQKVLASKDTKSLHSAARLKSGLCYEALNDKAQAEKLYAQIRDEDKDSASAKSAEKYLRLLQAKQ